MGLFERELGAATHGPLGKRLVRERERTENLAKTDGKKGGWGKKTIPTLCCKKQGASNREQEAFTMERGLVVG